MDPTTLLRLLAVLVVAVMGVGALRSPPGRRVEAFLVVVSVVAVGGATFVLSPAWGPLAILVAAPVLGVAPMRLEPIALRGVLDGRLGLATNAARLASLLRPFGPTGRLARDVSTLVSARVRGATPELLARLDDPRHPERAAVLAVLARHVGSDARGIREVLAIPSRRKRALAAGLGLAWIDAVARTAGPEEVLLALDEIAREDPTWDDPERRARVVLEAAAALGDRAGVELLLGVLAGRLPRGDDLRLRTIAALADGARAEGRALLDAPAPAIDPAIDRALRALRPLVGRLGARVPAEGLATIVAARDEALAGVALSPLGPRGLASVTTLLAAVLVGYHLLVERLGDATDAVHLAAMGGLRVPLQGPRDAAHLLTVPLVHAGAVHLVLNVLALVSFGPWVERLLGRGRMLLVFLAATVVSGLAVAGLATRPTVLVGASGAIFGLGGAMGAVLLVHPRLRRTRRAQEVLRSFGAMLVLQLVVDRLVPVVSGTAHVAGLLGGALAGLVLVPRPAQGGEGPIRPPAPSSPPARRGRARAPRRPGACRRSARRSRTRSS